MKNNLRLDTPEQKEIYSRFRYLSERFGPWQVWSDFITLSACTLNVAGGKRREEEYLIVSNRYSNDELGKIAEMFSLTVQAMDKNSNQDFLGDLFMRFDLGNSWKGQFFTPYCICAAMAQITAGDLKEQVEKKHWISLNDPACGAGATLVAFANECRRQEVNYQNAVLFVGQDIDRVAALMCYIQISLLGCPGYIAVGDTLTTPLEGSPLFPEEREGLEIWTTPFFHIDVWNWRRVFSLIKYQNGEKL